MGFDGWAEVGGFVTQDWVGIIQLLSIDSKAVPLASSFNVTCLGSVNAIFGFSWLDQQGWVASGSLKDGHQFTLGSAPLCVIDLSLMGGKPEGKEISPL